MTAPRPELRSPEFYTRFSAFGWLCVLAGLAYIYIEHAAPSVVTLGAGVGLVLLGGISIDRTPVVTFVTLIIDGIKAWRGRSDP